MVNDKIFIEYYLKYLGVNQSELNGGQVIKACSQRERPINNWHFQHLILTNINDTYIYSISPKLYRNFKEYMLSYTVETTDDINVVLDEFFSMKLTDYSIKKMYRLTFDKEKRKEITCKKAIRLTKNILMDNIKDKSKKEKDEIWIRKKEEVEQGRQFTILDKGKITCWCKVSDIDCGGGNLAVWTAPEYRKKGYGKDIVGQAIKWCLDNDIIPIYWVDSLNTPSINLAKSLGFKVKCQEIVVSTQLSI